MGVPSVPRIPGLHAGLTTLAGLAAFLRDRLAARLDIDPAGRDPAGRDSARQLAIVVVAAAAPFAPTSYARARLLRQLHASGLLTAAETEQAEHVLGVAQ